MTSTPTDKADEVVAGLRRISKRTTAHGFCEVFPDVLTEAADLIASMKAERDAQANKISSLWGMIEQERATSSAVSEANGRLLAERDALKARCIELGNMADGYGKLDADYAIAEQENATLQARLAEVEGALQHDLNVTDEELLRIRNGAERNADGDVKIWGKMLLKIVDAVRYARSALLPSETREGGDTPNA